MDVLLLTQQAEAVSVSYVPVSWEDIKLEEPGDSHELRSLYYSRPDPKICLSGVLPPACALRGTWGTPSPTRKGKYMTLSWAASHETASLLPTRQGGK